MNYSRSEILAWFLILFWIIFMALTVSDILKAMF